MYRCKKCKTAVIVAEGKIIKACNCEAPVVMELQAACKGKGGVKV